MREGNRRNWGKDVKDTILGVLFLAAIFGAIFLWNVLIAFVFGCDPSGSDCTSSWAPRQDR